MVPVLRVARPTNDLDRLRAFYVDGAGFDVLAEFAGHDGFDGLVVGIPHAAWHLEFVAERDVIAPSAPSAEAMLVLYIPDHEDWVRASDRMEAVGARRVPSHNPYWDRTGVTFLDPDGYGLVLQNASWSV